MTRNLEIFKWEFKKLYQMPAFYALVIMCIAFNIYLFLDAKGHSLDSIEYDAAHIDEVKENYAYDYYKGLDWNEIKKLAVKGAIYDDMAETMIIKNYKRLASREKEMTEKERNSVSFTGGYRLHSLLFGGLFRTMLMEGMLIITLVVLYSMHHEQYHQTEELAFTGKIGRNLLNIKFIVSGVYALVLCNFVIGITLGVYFAAIDYSKIWNSYISSNFNVEKRVINDLYLHVYPYITWRPMTVNQYLWAELGLGLLIFLFMLFFTALLSVIWKNSISVLAITIVTFGIAYILGNGIQFPNALEYMVKLNPVHLLTKCGYWFMDYSPGDSYPYYEILTVGTWNITVFVGLRYCFSRNYTCTIGKKY